MLENKIKQLKEKLRDYEKSNDEIIASLSSSNHEIRALTEEIYSEKAADLSASRGSKYSMRSGLPQEENNEILKSHYESDIKQLNEFQKREEYRSKTINVV